MKIKYIILLAGVAAFSSCSTAYRSGQTPDDVYYSPAPQENSYVSQPSDGGQDFYYYRNNEENDIRSGINDPVYRSPLTLSMGFGYNPYSTYPYNYGFLNPYYGGNSYYGYSPYGYMYSPYSPYSLNIGYMPDVYGYGYGYDGYGYGHGYGYSPYSYPLFYSSKSVNTNIGARRYNLGAYDNNNGRSTSTESSIGEQPVRTATTQPTQRTGVGNVIRRVFSPAERNTYTPPNNNTRRTYNNNNERANNSYRNDNYQTPQRSFTPSTNTESSSPSSSGGNAPVRSFRR